MLIALISAVPFAVTRWYFTPILLLPVLVGVWAVRAGVDVTPAGLKVRGAFASRRLGWEQITGFQAVGNRVYADLDGGSRIALPSVRPVQMPRLMSAGGQRFDAEPGV